MPADQDTSAPLRVSQRRPLACRGNTSDYPLLFVELINVTQSARRERGNAISRSLAPGVGG